VQERHVVTALRILIGVGGIIIGARHGMEAADLIASSKAALPVSAWIFLVGPLSTFPASLTALVNPKIGAMWLSIGAAASILPVLYERFTGSGPFLGVLAQYSLPLITLAALAWLLAWRQPRTISIPA
jgi:hypothetical protein